MVLLTVHVAGGALALAAGAAALSVRKGGRAHAKAGTLFLASMLVVLVTGVVMAIAQSIPNVAVGGVFGIYLVATSWSAARMRDGRSGRFERVALVVALACMTLDVVFGLQAAASAAGRLYGYPPAPYFASAGITALAAALDLNFILRGDISPARRIGRHVWRMCAALLFTTVSFFIGQQKAMPDAWHGSFLLLIPPLTVLALTLFWLVRVRFARAFAYSLPDRHDGAPVRT